MMVIIINYYYQLTDFDATYQACISGFNCKRIFIAGSQTKLFSFKTEVGICHFKTV